MSYRFADKAYGNVKAALITMSIRYKTDVERSKSRPVNADIFIAKRPTPYAQPTLITTAYTMAHRCRPYTSPHIAFPGENCQLTWYRILMP